MINNESKEQHMFSIILYINNDDYKKSIQSILDQDLRQFHPIQFIVIPDVKHKNIMLNDEFGQESSNIQILTLCECEDMKKAYISAADYVSGEYINYMECGSVYESNLLSILKGYIEEQDFPYIFLPKYLKEQSSFSKYVPEKSGIFPFSQYKKTVFSFFPSCFIPSEVEINFDYSENYEDFFLVRVLLGMIRKYPHLFVLKEESVIPGIFKRNFNDLYEVYQNHADILKEFYEVFLRGICEEYQDTGMPPFVQYTVLSYLKWCVKRKEAPHIIASLYDEDEFRERMATVLRCVSDRYIFDNKSFSLSEELFLAHIKYGGSPEEIKTRDNIEFWYGWRKITSVSKMQIKMDFVEITKSSVQFILRESHMNCRSDEIETWMMVNGNKKVAFRPLDWPYETSVFGKKLQKWNTYRGEIPLDGVTKEYSIEIFSNYKGKIIKRTSLAFQRYMPIVGQLSKCYYYDSSGYILQYDSNSGILTVKRAGTFSALGKEMSYLVSLIKSKDPFARKACFSRIL